MAAADVHAGMIGRHQRAGDAQIFDLTQQMLGVLQAEGEAEDGADRAQRDVALVPGNAHADHFPALPLTLADDTEVGNGSGVRAGLRAGQGEGGNLQALGQAWQVMVLLCLGAVVQQQFGRPQRVGHHDRDRGGRAARGQLLDHGGMGDRGELEAAVALRDDHAEEALFLHIGPDSGRQVEVDLGRLPVTGHGAERLALIVEERLFRRRERGLRIVEQLLPGRLAGEQLALPPDGAGFQRFALGLRHRRQHAFVGAEDRPGDEGTAQRRQQQQRRERDQYGDQKR